MESYLTAEPANVEVVMSNKEHIWKIYPADATEFDQANTDLNMGRQRNQQA